MPLYLYPAFALPTLQLLAPPLTSQINKVVLLWDMIHAPHSCTPLESSWWDREAHEQNKLKSDRFKPSCGGPDAIRTPEIHG